MSTVRISWAGNLNEDEKEALNDVFNLMGMASAVEQGLMTQEMLDRESARLEEKYRLDKEA